MAERSTSVASSAATRTVLCIEPDGATVAEIRRWLEPQGLYVENIPNGDEALEWGRQNPPSLVIVSVEPRKIGYAIANKLRRSPTLREVPLILISAEETMATFDQHRKLKSRADDYLLKPLDRATFLTKVQGLIGLEATPQPGQLDDDDDEIHELDADSDIVMAEDDLDIVGGDETEDEAGDEDRTLLGDGGDAEPAGETTAVSERFEGERFDPETQAAFAALEAGGGETAPQGSDMVDLRTLWSDEDLPPNLAWEHPASSPAAEHGNRETEEHVFTSALGHGEEEDPDIYRTGETLGPEPLSHVVLSERASAVGDLGVPPSPDEIEFGDVATETSGRAIIEDRTAPAVDPARLREAETRNNELAARIHSLENERQTLRKEIEEARERFTQSASFSKEREFLGLREIINKKEKDILDLRDALDAKERQILDHKDKIRELERARRDLEESSIGFERNLVAANERVAELVADREKSGEREKQLKARLDDAHHELRSSHDEIDALKKRLAQEESRARMEVDRVRADMEARLGEQADVHRAELARLNDEHAQALASVEAARQAELLRIEVAHRAEVESLQRRLSEEQVQSAERLTSEVGKLRKDHERALAAAREEQGLQLASERQAYETLAEQKERDHRNEIMGMRRRHEEELAAGEERRQRDIAEQEGRRVAELEAAESRRRSELQARDEEAHVRLIELERRHLTEKTELTEKHRAEYDQALGRAARAEAELAARIQEIEQAYRRLAGLEADIDAARAELGNRDVRIAQQRDRIAELEGKVADYEEQVVRAFQRIRADDKTAEKTRRALAVALALLDERGQPPAAAVGASAGAGAKPVSDEQAT